MLRKTLIFLAGAVVIGAAALAPNFASARGGHGGGGGGYYGYGRFGYGGPVYDSGYSCWRWYGRRRVWVC
jgi:hypothetical protein